MSHYPLQPNFPGLSFPLSRVELTKLIFGFSELERSQCVVSGEYLGGETVSLLAGAMSRALCRMCSVYTCFSLEERCDLVNVRDCFQKYRNSCLSVPFMPDCYLFTPQTIIHNNIFQS